MSGFNISVNKNAKLVLGSGYINYGCNIGCFNSISIGNEVAIGENVTIRDSDNHYLYREGSIVAAGAIVTKSVPNNCIVAGNPARIIRKNVTWGHNPQ